MQQIEQDKEEFLSICRQHIKRDGINNLLEWLETSDFFKAPASSKFHSSHEGGLCEHSLKVYHLLKRRLKDYPDIRVNDETVAISALFHDVCKVNFYKEDYRNVKDLYGNWTKVKTYVIDELQPLGDHSDKSIILLQRYIKLTDEEIYAIRGHMGAFDSASKGGSYLVNKIFALSKLAVLLHLSDTEASYLLET